MGRSNVGNLVGNLVPKTALCGLLGGKVVPKMASCWAFGGKVVSKTASCWPFGGKLLIRTVSFMVMYVKLKLPQHDALSSLSSKLKLLKLKRTF